MSCQSDIAPIFVLGCPRSGTTFLSSMLQLTDYGAPFESQFIIKYFDKIGDGQVLSRRAGFSRSTKKILQERAVRQWRIDVDIDRLFDRLPQPTYPALVDALCLAMVRERRPDSIAWGDKTPVYTLRWKALHGLFPESKFIYISRDGRDVALSLMKRPWGPATAIACARLWKKYIDIKQDIEETIGPDRLLFVGYEQLLENPAKHISRIYDFLGASISTADRQRLASTTRQDNSHKWRTRMSESDQVFFERAVGDTLREEGYETRYSQGHLSILIEARSRLQDGSKTVKHLLTQNLLDPIAIRFFGKEPFND